MYIIYIASFHIKKGVRNYVYMIIWRFRYAVAMKKAKKGVTRDYNDCTQPISYPEYARSQVRCWAWLWRNGMKLSISLAGVRSITPIPEIGVQVRELHVEIPEYNVNKVEINTFICKISNTS
jgi:hypothetical protein